MSEQLSRSPEKIEVEKKEIDLCKYCFKSNEKCDFGKEHLVKVTLGKEGRTTQECTHFTSKKDGKSSNIVSFGYQPKTKTLFIGFKNGVYGYLGVELNVYKDMLRADSRGKFFFARIKNKYDSVKLDD